MSKLQDSFKSNALNEEKVFERVNADVFEKLAEGSQVFEKQAESTEVFEKLDESAEVFASHPNVFEIKSGRSSGTSNRKSVMTRVWASVVAAAALILVVGGGALYMKNAGDEKVRDDAELYASTEETAHNMAFAMISVDINPSFEIFVDENGLVLSITAVNDDAKTLDVTALIGLKSEDAVAGIIDLAEAAGFIKTEDMIDDYVVVSTVLLEDETDENKAKQENLGQLIRERVEAAGELDETTKVAIIKATQVELFEARGKQVPMGLYIINGMIENNGEMIPVAQFVADQNNLKQLLKRSQIAEKKALQTGDETDSATSETTIKDNGPQSSNANPNSTKPNETGANSNSTKPNETGANSNSTKPNETKANASGTKPSETGANPSNSKPVETGANPNDSKPSSNGGSKNG